MMWARTLRGAQDVMGRHLADEGAILRVTRTWDGNLTRYALVILPDGIERATIVGTDVALISPLELLAEASLPDESASTR